MVDRRSIQESGIRYFTEDNEVGKQKLGEKIKEIFEIVIYTLFFGERYIYRSPLVLKLVYNILH